jgi:MFS transporter, FSR family, fosmidomycin resistance protein
MPRFSEYKFLGELLAITYDIEDPMPVLRNRLFLAVAFGHITVDIMNSSGPVLLAFLSVPLGLSNSQIGLAASIYTFVGALSQPLFGWLADRYGSRWLAGPSVAWMAGFIALTTLAAQSGQFVLMVAPFVLASVGSGAFHPTGTMNAGLSVTQRVATATAMFFLFGQMGLAAGPVLSGFALQRIGLSGFRFLLLGTAPIVLFMLLTPFPATRPATQLGLTSSARQVAWGAIALLALLTVCRSWAQIGTVTFLPKLFQEKGWDPTSYGAVTGAMWLASAVTGVIAGQLADRLGRRQIVFVAMLAATVPLFFLPLSDSWVAFAMALLAGGLAGAPHSIIVVIAQALLPGQKALASGLTLGFIFGMGALASLGIGWLADLWTLPIAMQVSAGMALLGALLALVLPSTRTVAEAARQEVSV